MKKNLLLMVLAFVAIPFNMLLAQPNPGVIKKMDVYYFHGNHRCPTCNAIEKETKALLESTFKNQLNNGTIKLHLLNYEEDKNEAIVKKYEIWGSSLLLVDAKGKTTNLTEMAFASARNEAPKFKADLKKEVDKLLK